MVDHSLERYIAAFKKSYLVRPESQNFADVSTFWPKLQQLCHVMSRDTPVSDTSQTFSKWSIYWYHACVKIWSGLHNSNKSYEQLRFCRLNMEIYRKILPTSHKTDVTSVLLMETTPNFQEMWKTKFHSHIYKIDPVSPLFGGSKIFVFSRGRNYTD